jgi:hypothetical protein
MTRQRLFLGLAVALLSCAAGYLGYGLWLGFVMGDDMEAAFYSGIAVVLCGATFATALASI